MKGKNMKLLKIAMAGFLAISLLTGCSDAEDVQAVPQITAAPTSAPAVKKAEKTNHSFNLVLDDKVWGTAKINQIEKLQFSDWANSQAKMNDVDYCYSFNVTIIPKEVRTPVSVEMEPVFYRDGNKISQTANVGWSGFPKAAEFYSGGDKRTTIEVCVQPEKKLTDGDVCNLEFSSNGQNFDSVEVSEKSVQHAKKGPRLLKAKKEITVTSINGAKYAMTPKKVFLEEHFLDVENRDAGTQKYFDISYQVKAVKPPDKNIKIDNIKGVGENAALVCRGTIGVQAQDNGEVLYQASINAGRINYSDTDDLFKYVNEGSMLKFGYLRNVMTNRAAADGVNSGMQFVRIRVEFPDEAKYRSDKQLLKFKGRYLVYEIPISVRKLGVYFN